MPSSVSVPWVTVGWLCCTAVWAMALFLPPAWSRGKKNNIKLKTEGVCWLFSWLFFHRSVLGDAPGWAVLTPVGSCGSGGDAGAVRGYGVCSRMAECELAVRVCVLGGVMHCAMCPQPLFAGFPACPPHSSAMGTPKRASSMRISWIFHPGEHSSQFLLSQRCCRACPGL